MDFTYLLDHRQVEAQPRRTAMLKETIIEAIAAMYATTKDEVARDIRAIPRADEALEQLCEALEDAGY